MRARRFSVAMSINGSGSGSGFNIETDLMTFGALGVYGVSIITSIIIEESDSVVKVYDLPSELIYHQIKNVCESIGIDSAKIGVLTNSEMISSVAKALEECNIKSVADPIIVSKNGAKLLKDNALETLVKRLLPKTLITVLNVAEASILSGLKVENLEDAKLIARLIHERYGIPAVMIRGKELRESKTMVDVLYYDNNYYFFESESSPRECYYEVNSSFSATLAAYLAKGFAVIDAINEAKKFMTILLRYGIDINDDRCFINPAVYIEIPAAKYEAIENVRKAVEILLENQNLVLPYTPEVGINVAEAIKPMYVFSINDVAGVEGRIVKAGNRLIKVGEIRMGGSSHLARLLIALIRSGYSLRGAINVRFDKSLVEKAVRKGYKVVFIDRRKEPEEIKDAPTGTMEWIASQISDEIPDLIYDIGDIGKEPMIRILGDNSIRAVEKLIRILSDQ